MVQGLFEMHFVESFLELFGLKTSFTFLQESTKMAFKDRVFSFPIPKRAENRNSGDPQKKRRGMFVSKCC